MTKEIRLHCFWGIIITSVLMISCHSNGSNNVQYYQSSGKISVSHSETSFAERNQQGISDEDKAVVEFIAEMYNNRLYESYDFLEKHCTKTLLKKLSDDYEYISDGPAYAVSEFRTDSQDSKPGCDDKNNIIAVRNIGDGWFEYEFYDGGWLGKTQLKIVYQEGRIMMDSLKKVYDEFQEEFC